MTHAFLEESHGRTLSQGRRSPSLYLHPHPFQRHPQHRLPHQYNLPGMSKSPQLRSLSLLIQHRQIRLPFKLLLVLVNLPRAIPPVLPVLLMISQWWTFGYRRPPSNASHFTFIIIYHPSQTPMPCFWAHLTDKDSFPYASHPESAVWSGSATCLQVIASTSLVHSLDTISSNLARPHRAYTTLRRPIPTHNTTPTFFGPSPLIHRIQPHLHLTFMQGLCRVQPCRDRYADQSPAPSYPFLLGHAQQSLSSTICPMS